MGYSWRQLWPYSIWLCQLIGAACSIPSLCCQQVKREDFTHLSGPELSFLTFKEITISSKNGGLRQEMARGGGQESGGRDRRVLVAELGKKSKPVLA